MDLNQIMALANDPKVKQLIQSLLSNQGGGQGGGGLGDILGKLTGNGMQQQVQSWVGDGENQPVTGQQLESALGEDTLAKAAEQAGMSTQEAADGLADVLPKIVDKASPDGTLSGPVGAAQ